MIDRTRVVAERQLALRAVPDAAPQARAALRELLDGTSFDGRLDDGELAVSELVTNAVLHGRAPIAVHLLLSDERVRVEVHDGSPMSPSSSMLDPTAVTGRGLMLITAASDRWGVDPAPLGKQVWFELLASGTEEEFGTDVDALLAAWGDDLAGDPALEQVRVVLTDLDTALVARAEAHVEGLLRELSTLGGEVPDEIVRVARAVLRAAAGVEAVRADLKHQLAVAVSSGTPLVDLTLTVQRDAAGLVRDFSHAVDEADRLSRAGRLLTTPALSELSEARRSYLRRLLAQLQS